MAKLGPAVRGTLYIQLANFPNNYLVLVVADDDFRYALITVDVQKGTMYAELAINDVAWVVVDRMHGQVDITTQLEGDEVAVAGQKRKRSGPLYGARTDPLQQPQPPSPR